MNGAYVINRSDGTGNTVILVCSTHQSFLRNVGTLHCLFFFVIHNHCYGTREWRCLICFCSWSAAVAPVALILSLSLSINRLAERVRELINRSPAHVRFFRTRWLQPNGGGLCHQLLLQTDRIKSHSIRFMFWVMVLQLVLNFSIQYARTVSLQQRILVASPSFPSSVQQSINTHIKR